MEPTTAWLERHSILAWETVFDQDQDGFTSQQEFMFGTNPLDPNSRPYVFQTTPEGHHLLFNLVRGIQFQLETSTNLTSFGPIEIAQAPGFPLDEMTRFFRIASLEHPNSDGDCFSDFEEINFYGTDPNQPDSDGDGLSDCDEILKFRTDPLINAARNRGRITGRVVREEASGQPLGLPGWTVFTDLNFSGDLDANERKVETGLDGHFTFEEVDPGPYRIVAVRKEAWEQVAPQASPPYSADGFPDAVVAFEDAGTGPFTGPYGILASPLPGRTVVLSSRRALTNVSPQVILGPLPPRPIAAPIGTYSDVDALTISSNSAITVEFIGEELFDGPGPDLVVVALSPAGERAEIYAGPSTNQMTLLKEIDEATDVTIDLREHSIRQPIRFIKLKSLNNAGNFPGFDLVGFEALNYRTRARGHYDVVVGENQTVDQVDFVMVGIDRPPRVFLSAQPIRPRAGQTFNVAVTASDDLGIPFQSLRVDGVPQAIRPDGISTVPAQFPGIIHLSAEATDSAAQTAVVNLPILVLNSDGSLPDLNTLGLPNPSSEGAPTIRIATPLVGQILTNDIAIVGTLRGQTQSVTSWQLHYARADLVEPENLSSDDPDYVLIASGSGEVNTPTSLGSLPVSTLEPGAYILRTTATGGGTSFQGFVVGVKVQREDIQPSISITSPSPNASVTYLTEIKGSISTKETLREWTVEYAPASEVDLQNLAAEGPNWTVLAKGDSPMNDETLATFDPTRLPNDRYIIRVSAWNRSGLGYAKPLELDVIGTAKVGQFAVSFRDLRIDLAGIPIEIQREYNTLRVGRPGDFGYGWSLAVQQADLRETVPNRGTALVPTPFRVGTRVYLNSPTGKRLGFTFKPQPVAPSFVGTGWKVVFESDPGDTDFTLSVPERDRPFITITEEGDSYLFFIKLPYNPDTYVLTDKDGTRYTYHDREGLREIADSSQNRVTFSPTSIRHSSGVEILIQRDTYGRISSIRDPDGKLIRYDYDTAGNLIGLKYPAGVFATFGYRTDLPHYLEKIDDPLHGPIQRTEFDSQGRVEAIIDAEGNRFLQSWNISAFTGTFTDANGAVTRIHYDSLGNVVREINPLGGITTREYADSRHPNLETSVTNPNGNTTRYQYDERGNLLQEEHPLRKTISYSYDSSNNQTSITRPIVGGIQTIRYDDAGRPTQYSSPSQNYEIQYTPDGLPAVLKDPKDSFTRFEYSKGGREPTRVIHPNGHIQSFTYNSRGQITRYSDFENFHTEVFYDDLGRKTRQVDSRGHEQLTTYDHRFPTLPASQSDCCGLTTRYSYDAKARLIREEDPRGSVTRFEYDSNGNRTALIDPVGNRWEFKYDALNRLIEEKDPLGATKRHRYDSVGNRIETIDRNGRRLVFLFDALNRKVEEQWFNSESDTNLVNQIRYSYDRADRLTSVSDSNASYVYNYTDGENTLSSEKITYPGRPEETITYRRDGDLRPNRIWMLGRAAVHMTRYSDGQVGTVSLDFEPASVRAEFLRNRRGDLTETIRYTNNIVTTRDDPPRASSTTYSVDPRGWINRLEHRDPQGRILPGGEWISTRDPAGEILQVIEHGQTNVFGYDASHQLISVTQDGQMVEFYGYDAAGNRTNSHRHDFYVTGSANRLTAAGDAKLEYDQEGNLIRRIIGTDIWEYNWDHRNRLTKLVKTFSPESKRETKYYYDAWDRRISRDDAQGKSWCYYDGVNPFAEFDDATDELQFQYLYGDSPDAIIAIYSPSFGITWPLSDHLGTVFINLSRNGAVISESSYDRFGNRAIENSSQSRNMAKVGFVGRDSSEPDNHLGIRLRWYLPEIGRFISEDPAGFKNSEYNQFAYVQNRVLRSTDPTGAVTAPEKANFIRRIAIPLLMQTENRVRIKVATCIAGSIAPPVLSRLSFSRETDIAIGTLYLAGAPSCMSLGGNMLTGYFFKGAVHGPLLLVVGYSTGMIYTAVSNALEGYDLIKRSQP